MRKIASSLITGVSVWLCASCALNLDSLSNLSGQLRFSVPVVISTYTCAPITLSSSSVSGDPLVATATTPISLSGLGQGQAYSTLSNCQAGTSSTSIVFINAGSSQVTFYYRTNAAETLNLVASSTSTALTAATQPLYTVMFQVLGQLNTTSNSANSGGVSASTMSVPLNTYSDGTHLIVVDSGNHRVLIWNSIPMVNGQMADIVLGQPNLTSNTANNGGLSASSLSSPTAVFTDGTRVYVADTGNNRILIWNTFPTVNGQAANIALGQPDLLSNTANNGGLSASTLSAARAIYSNGTKLYVADSANNRVLGWNSIPTVSGQAANFALGQSDLISSTANSGGISAASLSNPKGMHGDGTRLFVADSSNSRILMWNALPTANAQAANIVLGQSGFASNTANSGGISAATLSGPFGVFSDGTRVFIADTANQRVLGWNAMPTSNGQSADFVLGQPDFTSATVNNGGLSATSLQTPRGVFSDGTRVFILDQLNNRVTVVPIPGI